MNWKSLFPELQDAELIGQIEHHGVIKNFKAGKSLFDESQQNSMVPLVLEGSLKISREDDEGRELLMYYLNEGDTCAATLSCCLNRSKSKLSAVAESDVSILFFPSKMLNVWIDEYPCWRDFIMNTFQKRFDELLMTVDALAFQNMDQRLITYLQEKTIINNTMTLSLTHQKIADELHSSREVISRLLKQLERKDYIKLGRNSIEVFDKISD